MVTLAEQKARNSKKRSPVVVVFDPKDDRSLSRTVQSHKDTCDINKMLRRYSDINKPKDRLFERADRVAMFGNFDMTQDLGSIKLQQKNLEKAWYQIPAEIRKQFKNDPRAFIAYVNDPANSEAATKQGLKRSSDMVKYVDKDGKLLYEIPAGLNAEEKAKAIADYKAANPPQEPTV